MTSNPGDEKVIQDPVHFKKRVTSKSHSTGEIDITRFSTGISLIAYDDGGTTRVMGSNGVEQYNSDDDGDIGAIINTIQNDYPGGTHLHLADLFDYSTDILINSPIRITSEIPAVEEPSVSNIDPTGLNYTGSSDPFIVKPPDGSFLGGVQLESLYLNAGSGNNGIKFEAYDSNNSQGILNSHAYNIVVEGGNGTGFWIHENVFGSVFDNIICYNNGGKGFRVDEGGVMHKPSQITIGRVKIRESTDEGIYFGKVGESSVQRLYSLRAGTDGISLQSVDGCDFAHLYAEKAGDDGVLVGGSCDNNSYGTIISRDSASQGVAFRSTPSRQQVNVIRTLADDSVFFEIDRSRVGSILINGTGSLTAQFINESVIPYDGTSVNNSVVAYYGGDQLNYIIDTTVGPLFQTRTSDPSTSELGDGQMMIYVSDGSTEVTGDDGDAIIAVNNGGTIKTGTLLDFSAA